MNPKSTQGGFSFFLVFILLFIGIGTAVAIYLLNFQFTPLTAQEGFEKYTNKTLGFEFVYPQKTDTGLLSVDENYNQITVSSLRKNYLVIDVVEKVEDPQAWWESHPQNENKKLYALYKPIFFKVGGATQIDFRQGSLDINSREIVMTRGNKTYLFRLLHGNCTTCTERGIEDSIMDSVRFF